MSICPIDRKQCDCQPDEGVPCSATEDKSVIARLAYEAGEFNARSICEAKYLRAKARIAHLEAELAEARKQPTVSVTRAMDAMDVDPFGFIDSFAHDMAPEERASARVEHYNYERGLGVVVTLWVHERLRAIVATVRDGMNWTVCTKVDLSTTPNRPTNGENNI